LLLTAFILANNAGQLTPVCLAADEPSESAALREVVEAVKIPIDEDLSLGGSFDYSHYYGLIRSQDELDDLWSGLISAKKPYASRLGFGLPDPPKVDFVNNSVIWFADKGAGASYVDSMLVGAYESDRKLFITFVAFHSDFSSDRLELWTIPLTGYTADFSVLHKYEEKRR